jgi:hypothetical protein
MTLRQLATRRTPVATSRVLFVGLWALITVAAIGGLYALIPRSGPPAVKIPEATVGPEGVAQMYVATWLRGGGTPAAGLSAYYPVKVPTTAASTGRTTIGATVPPPPAPVVGRTATVDAIAIAPRYTAVTVAVEIGVEPDIVVRYYRVPMYRTAANLYVATELPAEVAAPVGARLPKLNTGGATEPAANDPMAATVRGYLTALLTTDGDVSRFTAPGVPSHPVTPRPFSTIVLTGLASHPVAGPTKTAEVLAEITATEANGSIQTLAYSFQLAQRAGRWEVSKTLAGPTLSPTQPSLAPSSTIPGDSTTTSIAPPSSTTSSSTSTTRPIGGRTP